MDEAHQILTEQSYRHQFADLNKLVHLEVQLIMLTASLPKRLESEFLLALSLPPTTQIIRAPSDQPHISYNRIIYDSNNTDENRLAIGIAKILNTLMEPDQIGLIYCTSVEQVKAIGNAFTHCMSYANQGDKAEHEAIWKD